MIPSHHIFYCFEKNCLNCGTPKVDYNFLKAMLAMVAMWEALLRDETFKTVNWKHLKVFDVITWLLQQAITNV